MKFSDPKPPCEVLFLALFLEQLPLNPYIVNWNHSFLFARQRQIFYNNHLCNWKVVDKGTTQGSASGPYLFNIFLNDLEISYNNAPAPFKYGDDSRIVSPVSNQCDPSANLVGHGLKRTVTYGYNLKNCKELITSAEREVKDSRSAGMFQSCIRWSRSCLKL